jgi:hypothetical protein
MTSTLKTLAVAATLIAGIAVATGSALAGQDQTYHWAYPNNLKASVPHQTVGAGSGIPPLYR